MPDYDRIVKNLSPEAQRLLEQKLKGTNIPSEQALDPISGQAMEQPSQGYWSQTWEESKAPFTQKDIPFWKRGLAGFAAPFTAISEGIIKPLAAIATSPFTPSIEGAEGDSWLERELKEYKAWDDPNWKFIGVKGALEFLPWLAIPGVGIAAKGTGIAGKLARLGTVGKIAGTALEKSPWGIAEQATGKVMQAGGKAISTALKKAALKVEEELPVSAQVMARNMGQVLAKKDIEKLNIPDLYEAGRGLGTKLGEAAPVKKAVKEAAEKQTEVGTVMPAYVKQDILNQAGKGSPGIGFMPNGIVYRNPHGKPIAVATVIPQGDGSLRIGSVVTDSTSLLKGKATLAIVKELREFPGNVKMPPKSEMSPDALKLADRFEKMSMPMEARQSGEEIAKQLGVRYDGIQQGLGNQFTDPVTGSTFYGNTVEHASERLAGMRSAFGVKETGETVLNKTVGGEVPPTKPPVPPATKLMPEEPDEFDKFWQAISGRKAEKLWEATQTLRNKEVARRASMISQRVSKLTSEGKLTEETYAQVWKELGSGELPSMTTRMGFTQEFKDEGIRRINEVLVNKPYEAKATVTAFTNALEGKPIPRTVGVKGGSAYTRLAAVFGKEAADAMSNPEKLKAIAERIAGKTSPTPPAAETIAYLRGLSNVPSGQALLFEHALTKEGTQVEMFTPFSPDILNLSSKEIMERLGYGAVKDTRTAAQKQLDYLAMLRTAGKIPNEVTGGIPSFPSENLAKQLSLLPDANKKTLSDMSKRLGGTLVDLANAPRTLLASVDLSGLLLQGGTLSAYMPRKALEAVRPMVTSAYRKETEVLMDSIFRARPHVNELIANKLYVAPTTAKTAPLFTREESMMSRKITKIPVIGQLITGSQRAYITALNDLRTAVGSKVCAQWEKAGNILTKQDYSDVARIINWASGRGSLPKGWETTSPILNALFFSPRLILSRFELPLAVFPFVTKSAMARKMAQQMVMRDLATGASILAMAKMTGVADIELDPRSADFAKLKIGDTRLDIWSGFAQYFRFGAQLVTGQKKSESGFVYSPSRKEIADRFLRSKFSPAVGLINDLMTGQTFLGEELPPKTAGSAVEQLYQRTMPLAIQDMIDGYQQGGALGAFVASPSILGVGVVAYTDDLKKARDTAAKKEYGMTWDEVGLRYGKATQLKLEQKDKGIMKAEQDYEQRYVGGSLSAMKQWYKDGQSIEDTYRQAIVLASNEFNATKDGVTYREKVSQAAAVRRQMYAARSSRKEYQSIVDYYNKPLTQDQINEMNPGDFARRQYYQMMYGQDMYDQYGNYLFSLADKREQEFLLKYGQAALDYIDEYQGSRWIDKPVELQYLEKAKEILQPYWQITDYVWSLYPPEVKALSDQITLLERTDPERARQALKRYPQILRARELIATYKKQLKDRSPAIQQAFSMFYG